MTTLLAHHPPVLCCRHRGNALPRSACVCGLPHLRLCTAPTHVRTVGIELKTFLVDPPTFYPSVLLANALAAFVLNLVRCCACWPSVCPCPALPCLAWPGAAAPPVAALATLPSPAGRACLPEPESPPPTRLPPPSGRVPAHRQDVGTHHEHCRRDQGALPGGGLGRALPAQPCNAHAARPAWLARCNPRLPPHPPARPPAHPTALPPPPPLTRTGCSSSFPSTSSTRPSPRSTCLATHSAAPAWRSTTGRSCRCVIHPVWLPACACLCSPCWLQIGKACAGRWRAATGPPLRASCRRRRLTWGPQPELGAATACHSHPPSPRLCFCASAPQLLRRKALEKAAPSDASSRNLDAEAGKPLLNGSSADSKPQGSKE